MFELSCKVLLVVLFLGFTFLILLAIFFPLPAVCVCPSACIFRMYSIMYVLHNAACA